MRKSVYVSGKMGEKRLSKKTKEKFLRAAERLKADGWQVINPADDDYQAELRAELRQTERQWKRVSKEPFDWFTFVLLYDLHAVAISTAVYMLSDWASSPGARSEHAYATACGKEIIYEDNDKKE